MEWQVQRQELHSMLGNIDRLLEDNRRWTDEQQERMRL